MFQGSCNPLTSLSMFITFVEPILLYGCEVWFLTELNCYVGQISGGRNWKTYTSITKIQQYFCKGSLEMAQFHCAHFAQKTDVCGQVADYSKSNSSSVRIFHTMVSKGDVLDA